MSVCESHKEPYYTIISMTYSHYAISLQEIYAHAIKNIEQAKQACAIIIIVQFNGAGNSFDLPMQVKTSVYCLGSQQ